MAQIIAPSDMEPADHDQPAQITLVRGATDADRAKTYRERMDAALKGVLEIINEARQHDITIQFQLGEDGFGRQAVGALHILKKL